MVGKEDLEGLKIPVSMACTGMSNEKTSILPGRPNLTMHIENDQLFPDDVREAGKKYLEENKVEHEIRVYSGMPHGMPTDRSANFLSATSC